MLPLALAPSFHAASPQQNASMFVLHRQASATDIGARLAIVPMGSEARGLDAAPRLAQRLRSANDHPTAALVDTIGAQEKAHVAVGVYWFSQISAALGACPCVERMVQAAEVRMAWGGACVRHVFMQL
jgi:uncharacterized ferritin-like protein (DUF455 family)